jgi:hypothetical protein
MDVVVKFTLSMEATMKVTGELDRLKEEVDVFLKVVIFMKVNFRMVKLVVMDAICLLITSYMRDIGKMISTLAKESLSWPLVFI